MHRRLWQRGCSDGEPQQLYLDYVEKDFEWRYSRKTVPVYMQKVGRVIRPVYPHCGYMAAEPNYFMSQIKAFMEMMRSE